MKHNKKLILLILLTLVIITVISCTDQSQTETKTSSIFQRGRVRNIRITANKADVKSGVSQNARTITSLNKNEEAKVLGELGDWYVVSLGNRRIGGIKKDDAKPIVKEGQKPQKPLPTQDPPREEAPQTEVEPARNLTTLEQKMISLINSERKDNGLPTYKVDSELTRVARIKAKDMVDNNYFSHYSPTYGSPFDMMDHFDIEYHRAGENIAANQSVDRAHNSLMNSRGHRQNILNEHFTHIGIGIKPSDKYGYIFVQMFISKPQ